MEPPCRVLAGLALRDLTLVETLLQVVEKLDRATRKTPSS